MSAPPAPDEDFFVGYLPTPARLRGFHLAAVGAAIAVALAVAATLASTSSGEHGHFGGGEADFVGVFAAEPVPLLRVADPSRPGGVRTLLVVRGGKFGLPPTQSAELDGRVVRLRGGLVERDGTGMIEIYQPPEDATLEPAARASIESRPRVARGRVELRGELVDSKCWLGRMHPGAGRTHRACAQQCVAGGIPAVLVTRDAAGTETLHVLAGLDDGSLEHVLELLSDPVQVAGELEQDADLWILRVEAGSLTRP